MNTGLFFGSTNGEVEAVAESLKAALGPVLTTYQNIGTTEAKDLEAQDNLILGISTWNIGQLQIDWEAFWPKLDQANLQGKKVAIFGLGDQVGYPDSYQDAIGMLADKVRERGATVVAMTVPEGQEFTASKGMKDGKMQGLALDKTNQDELTDQWVQAWLPQLRAELGLAATPAQA